MSSVQDVPGLARAVAGPVGAAAPAGAAVNTFWSVSKRSTRPKSRPDDVAHFLQILNGLRDRFNVLKITENETTRR